MAAATQFRTISEKSRLPKWAFWPVLVSLLFILQPMQGQEAPQESSSKALTSKPASDDREEIERDRSRDESRDAQREPLPYSPASVSLETGQALRNPFSSLRWGRLSLLSLNAIYLYDDLSLGSTSHVLSRGGALRGHLVYDIRRGTSGLSLQYLPQLLFSQDRRQANYGAHSVDFQTFRYLSDKWALTISDALSYTPDQGYVGEPGHVPDFDLGVVRLSPLLATGRKYLENSARASVDYVWGYRDRLSLLGHYRVTRVSEDLTTSRPGAAPSVQIDHLFGGGMAWTHRWNRENELRLSYTYDRRYFRSPLGRAEFHTWLASYRRRLRPSVRLHLAVGPALMVPEFNYLPATKTYEASAILFKKFRSSGVMISYFRNHNFTGLLSDYYNDRFGVSYQRRFGQRWQMNVGAGYIRQEFTDRQPISGRSAWGSAHYRLGRDWTAFVSYVHYSDTGGFRLPGSRHQLITGFRWSWVPRGDGTAMR